MPGYIGKPLKRLQYSPHTPQYYPYKYHHFKYGEKGSRQYVKDEDTSLKLSEREKHGYSQ